MNRMVAPTFEVSGPPGVARTELKTASSAPQTVVAVEVPAMAAATGSHPGVRMNWYSSASAAVARPNAVASANMNGQRVFLRVFMSLIPCGRGFMKGWNAGREFIGRTMRPDTGHSTKFPADKWRDCEK